MRLLLTALILLFTVTATADYRKVTIKNSVHVSDAQVLLKDLLVDPELVSEEEANYAIVEAPKSKKYYTLRNLAYAMQQHSSLKDLQLYGSGRLVKVIRVADEAMLIELQRSIKKAIATTAPWKDYLIDIKLGESDIQRIASYTDADAYKITKVENGSRLRTVKVSVALYKENKAYRKVQLNLAISRKIKVVTLDETKRRGDIINTSDLSLVEQWVAGDLSGLLTEIKQARDFELRYPRAKGQMLRSSDLLQPIYVQKNQVIQAVTLVGSFVLRKDVTALSKGRRGDLVRVRNERSGRIFQARVVADRLVEVQ